MTTKTKEADETTSAKDEPKAPTLVVNPAPSEPGRVVAELQEAGMEGVDNLVSVRFDGEADFPATTRVSLGNGLGFLYGQWTPVSQEVADYVTSKEVKDQGLKFTTQTGQQAFRSLQKQAAENGQAVDLVQQTVRLAVNPQLPLGTKGAGTTGALPTSLPPGGQPNVGQPASVPSTSTGTGTTTTSGV